MDYWCLISSFPCTLEFMWRMWRWWVDGMFFIVFRQIFVDVFFWWRFNPVMVGGNLEMISSFQVFGGRLINDDEALKLKLWEKRFAPMWLQRMFVSDWVRGSPKHGPDLSLGYCKIISVFHSESCFCWTKTTPGQMFQRTISAYPIIYIFV